MKSAFLILILLCAAGAFGQTAENKSPVNVSPKFREKIAPEKLRPVGVPRFATAPVIDGKLDDEIWKTAAVFKDFYQTSPGDNVAPSKPTEAFMGYDAENLYVAFHCFDEPDKVRATVAKRDEVFGEDHVRVYLDTYDDQRRAYILGFNPLGIQQDGLYTEADGSDFSVDIVMESKGAMTSDGWSVEIKIPFKSLRYTAGKNKFWGIQLSRVINRFNNESDSWMPRDRDNSSFLAQAGKITGLEGIKVERTLELVPSITLSQTGERVADDNSPTGQRFLQRGLKRDLSLNAKLSITPNITLDATIKPDFAEIEADAPVVTANQRFPIYFEEKRPFFLEGADIFQSPLSVVYTRTIQKPDAAAKLTGKIGRNTFGILAASDKPIGATDNALIGIVRVKRDVGRENSVGFFGTARLYQSRLDPQSSKRNYLGGFDGRFRLNPKTTFTFQAVGTHSRRLFYNPDIDNNQFRTGNGAAYSWSLDYTERDKGFYLQGDGVSRDYRADVGFTQRTNTNAVFFTGRLSTPPNPKADIIRLDYKIFSRFRFNWQGKSQRASLGNALNLTLKNNTFLNIESGEVYERLFEDEFGARRNANQSGAFFGASERSAYQPYISIYASTAPSKRINFEGSFFYSLKEFDFDFGVGQRFPRSSLAYSNYLTERLINPNLTAPALDPGPGRSLDASFSVQYKPIDPLRVSFSYEKSSLVRNDTKQTAFDDNIATVRATYQFSRFAFVRTRFDYDSIAANARGQVLFGYNPSPGKAFYVGYNDDFNYNGFNPFTNIGEPRFARNSRTFFIRASYLFRRSF